MLSEHQPSSGLTIAFDADDTLWHNENAFAAAEAQFDEIVAAWADADEARSCLVAHQRARVATNGYGVKSFALAMIAAACEISNNEIPAATLKSIVDIADDLLVMPTIMIDGARETLSTVSRQYRTMILTKGDLHHQLRRIAEVDVARHCFDVEVVSEKDPATYERLLARHRIAPADFVMIGNSIVSDVAPVLEVGGRAVHIPYEVTWALETAKEDPPPSDRWFRLDSITELPNLIDTLQ